MPYQDRGPALIVLYKMLAHTGLTVDEADQFVFKLHEEFRNGAEFDKRSIEEICQKFVDTLEDRDRLSKKKLAGALFSTVAGGLAIGVAGNFLTDALKDAVLLKGAPRKSETLPKEAVSAESHQRSITFGPYIVFFDWDQSDLQPEARAVLDSAVLKYQFFSNTRLMVAGYADRSKSTTSNFSLSQRRAEAVRDYLILKGISGRVILTRAFGEGRPLVMTNDGIREPQNRRAEISAI